MPTLGQNTPVANYPAGAMLTAAFHPAWALMHVLPVNLAPNVSIPRGSLLNPPSGTGTSAVQTITPPGSGSYTLSGVNPVTGAPWTAAPLAFGANDAAVALAINNALTNGVTVTVAALAVTYGGAGAKMPVALMTTTAGSVANTTPGVSVGTYTLYAGSGNPTVWTQYDYSTDAVGNVTYGLNSGTGDDQRGKHVDAPCYYAGEFYSAQMPNLDAAAIASLKAHFITGALGTPGAVISIR